MLTIDAWRTLNGEAPRTGSQFRNVEDDVIRHVGNGSDESRYLESTRKSFYRGDEHDSDEHASDATKTIRESWADD